MPWTDEQVNGLGETAMRLDAENKRLRAAMKRAADMLPANAACGVLRAALAHEQKEDAK